MKRNQSAKLTESHQKEKENKNDARRAVYVVKLGCICEPAIK